MLSAEFEPLQYLFGQSAAYDEFLGFDSQTKKRWLDTRPLVNQQFIKDAPKELRAHLETLRNT